MTMIIALSVIITLLLMLKPYRELIGIYPKFKSLLEKIELPQRVHNIVYVLSVSIITSLGLKTLLIAITKGGFFFEQN